jgi:uncharacterized protein YndB with AHSA1/START domain
MPVTKVEQDPEWLTLSISSEFEAEPGRVWQLWENPRLLEKWWGPPTHPATFVLHDLSPGGEVTYFMTGPKGEEYHGWWRVVSADPPLRLEFEDGFADAEGRPDPAMPMMLVLVTIEADGDQEGMTQMLIQSTFSSLEEMEKVLEMGAAEGMAQALGQIDGLLAGETA